METKEPTREQIKRFAQWCGFTDIRVLVVRLGWDGTAPNGEFKLVEIDLNNLFKYAVPKLQPKYNIELITWREGKYKIIINKVCQSWAETFTTEIDTDLALALFWAIWRAFLEEKALPEEAK